MTSDNKTEQPPASAMDAASLNQQAEPHDDAERGELFPKMDAEKTKDYDRLERLINHHLEELGYSEGYCTFGQSFRAIGEALAATQSQGVSIKDLEKRVLAGSAASMAKSEKIGWNMCVDHLSSKYTITPKEGE